MVATYQALCKGMLHSNHLTWFSQQLTANWYYRCFTEKRDAERLSPLLKMTRLMRSKDRSWSSEPENRFLSLLPSYEPLLDSQHLKIPISPAWSSSLQGNPDFQILMVRMRHNSSCPSQAMCCFMHGERARNSTTKGPCLQGANFWRGKIHNINTISKALSPGKGGKGRLYDSRSSKGAEVQDFNRFHLPIPSVQPRLS